MCRADSRASAHFKSRLPLKFLVVDPDRLTLPVKLLTGSTEETEEEKKQRCLLSYFRSFDTAKKQRDEVAPHFVKK